MDRIERLNHLHECSHQRELARRYTHPDGGQCVRYYCDDRFGHSDGTERIYREFETDATTSGYGDELMETLALFGQWSNEEENSAHDPVAERLDELARNAGTIDRMRMTLYRDRLVRWLTDRSTELSPRPAKPLVPRDNDEKQLLRKLWRRHKLAPIANRLRHIAA